MDRHPTRSLILLAVLGLSLLASCNPLKAIARPTATPTRDIVATVAALETQNAHVRSAAQERDRQLQGTIEALATQNAELTIEVLRRDLELQGAVEVVVTQRAGMGTEVARWTDATSYLLTQVPAQNRAPTVAALGTHSAYLSTQVAELHHALGIALPPSPATATPGPPPPPTRTPFVPQPTAPPTPTPTVSQDG